MDDMEGQVRELLQHRADDVPPQLGVPPKLAVRAHRRVAANAIGASLVAIALIAGASFGLQAVRGAPVRQPGGTGGPAPFADGGPCTAPQLRAAATTEGAAGSREGAIVFTNISEASCTLQGTPTWLFNVNGDRIDGIDLVSSPARWQAEGDPKPAGWPVVTLEPRDRASIRLRWSNWCVQGELSWDMALAAGDGIVPIDEIGQDPPPCNGPDQPATIETGPFEPAGP